MWQPFAQKLVMPGAVWLAMLMIFVQPMQNSAAAQESELPTYTLDVLEDFVWSSTSLFLAPGQSVVITNRDVARHTFTVDEWNMDTNLPSLQPVEITVPESAEVGTDVLFYSSVPGDREGGLEGVITVVTPEEIAAGQLINPSLDQAEPSQRVRIEARDDFTFQPAIATVGPGTIIEVVNTGVITHHFVVDAWNVNQTIDPGAMVLIRVPTDARVGSSIDFYCSVPGHEEQGMVGVLRISGDQNQVNTVVTTREGRTVTPIDMRPFVPEATKFGQGWSRLRSGSSESILGNMDLNPEVFPYSGLGAVYVGPDGSRITLVVLPLETRAIPVNQVGEAVRTVQNALSAPWSVDRIASAAWRSVPPPNGCTVSERVSGIVPMITLPGGVTSCQLTGVGVAIFVAVEGNFENDSGVNASNAIVAQIVSGELTAWRQDP